MLVETVLDVAQLDKERDGIGIVQHIQTARTDCSGKAAAGLMLLVLVGECLPHLFGQLFTLFVFRLVIKEHIGLLAFAPAVNMNKECPFIGMLLLLGKPIDGSGALIQSFDLIQRNGLAHTGLALAVGEILHIADSIFRILNDDVYGGPSHEQVTGQPQDNVIGILIFVQLMFAHPTDGARIGSAMTTHQVKTGTFQLLRSHRVIGQGLAEQRFLPLLLCGQR